MAAVVILLVRALGAPLGEAVAEDFDFLYRARFGPAFSWWDGGGSSAFWRPIAHQLYYRVLGSAILAHPGWVAGLHVGLLASAGLLAYYALRGAMPAGWAAFAATFATLSESTRTLIAWPSHFVDLGAWWFTALCLHETARRRLPTALVTLALALGCKEIAVIPALLAPWLPAEVPRPRRERVRWAAAFAAVLVTWAVAYAWIRQHAGLHMPHGIESGYGSGLGDWAARLTWSLVNGVRALFSLPATGSRHAVLALGIAAALVAAALAIATLDPAARRRLVARRAWLAWGGAWFAASVAVVSTIHPLWAPNRTQFGAFGAGVVLAVLLGGVRPALLAGLAALRVALLFAAPGPPSLVTPKPPATGAFLDFEQLVRLERTLHDSRHLLQERYPVLPHGATVAFFYLPKRTEYAFGGGRALQVWYGDSTLRLTPAEQAIDAGEPVAAVLGYEPDGSTSSGEPAPHMLLLPPDALREYFAGGRPAAAGDWDAALAHLDRAEALGGRDSRVFRASILAARAWCVRGRGDLDSAWHEARRSVALWPSCPDGRAALAALAIDTGRWDEAEAALDSIAALVPDERRLPAMREALAAARARATSGSGD